MKSGKIYVTAAIGAGIVCIAAMLGVLSAAIYAEDEKNDSFCDGTGIGLYQCSG